jgi:hypothetical protein
MTVELFSNFAVSTLAAAVGASTTSIQVANASDFPTLSSGQQFRLTVQDSSVSVPEIMLVTGVSGNTFTVVRGYEGSLASAHAAGAAVLNGFTAQLFQNVYRNGRIVTGTSDQFGPYDTVLEVNQSGGACAISGPANPVPFKRLTLADGGYNASSNPITLTPVGGALIANMPSKSIETNGGAINFYYNGTNFTQES